MLSATQEPVSPGGGEPAAPKHGYETLLEFKKHFEKKFSGQIEVAGKRWDISGNLVLQLFSIYGAPNRRHAISTCSAHG